MHDKERWKLEQTAGTEEALLWTKPLVGSNVIEDVVNFSAKFPALSHKLFDYSGTIPEIGTALGKGELLLYFLYDNVTLGGNSSSIDIHINGVPYFEVKVARHQGQAWVDFRLGTDEFVAGHQLIGRVVELALKAEAKGKFVMPENFGNFSKSKLNELRALSAHAMRTAEEQYFKRLFSGRVGSKFFLFFDIVTRLPFYYGKLSRELVELERLSLGQSRLQFYPGRAQSVVTPVGG